MRARRYTDKHTHVHRFYRQAERKAGKAKRVKGERKMEKLKEK